MVGITSYGVYVPFYRLNRDEIAKAWNRPSPGGDKAVANFDEDAITMATAAALDCISNFDRSQINGLFLASTTLPYKEKQSAATVAAAIDLNRETLAIDFTNSLRAGTQALITAINMVKAGALKSVLVVASDCRLGAPQSEFEFLFGDGAVALLIGNSEVAVNFAADYAITNEFLDIWRTEEDTFVRSWEDRFIVNEGYVRNVQEAVSGLLKKHNLTAKDITKAVFYAPDPRSHSAMARTLGFDAKTQVQDHLFASVGNTGTAFTLMMLLAALKETKPKDRILLANYGDGADAFILEATEYVDRLKDRRSLNNYLQSRVVLSNYEKYLHFRNIVPTEPPRRPQLGSSIPVVWRDREGIYQFHGVKCRHCGTVQFPPSRVCINCQTKDQFDKVRLSDKRAEIFSFSIDHVFPSPDAPTVMTVINLEGGGRMNCHLTDRDLNTVKVGMPVEMTFRRMHSGAGFYNYFWKAKPVR